MNREEELIEIIKKVKDGEIKGLPPSINPRALLMAIATVESDGGYYGGVLRVENSYADRGRRYFNKDLYKMYGDAGAGSWSSWQIMYPTARELGFIGEPWMLWYDSVAIDWVIKYIENRIIRKANRIGEVVTVRMVADGYNSGTPFDKNIPMQYIAKMMSAYDKEIKGGRWS